MTFIDMEKILFFAYPFIARYYLQIDKNLPAKLIRLIDRS